MKNKVPLYIHYVGVKTGMIFFSLNDKLIIHVNLKCVSLLTKYFASKNLPEEGSNY